jgi:hypothetical protein
MTIKHRIVFALLMGIITTAIISFGLVAVSVGFGDAFLRIWTRSWALAYVVVIPIILIVAPKVQALVDVIIASRGNIGPGIDLERKKKVAFALMMGSITTGVISFVLIATRVGFRDPFLFVWLRSWGMSYLVVVPALLIIAPRVQRLVTKMLSADAALTPE